MAKDPDHIDGATGDAPLAWLMRHVAHGATLGDALEFFDSLPCVTLAEMIGVWRGSGLPTGHPMDGLLEKFGWWGKSFADTETVHPLLFTNHAGDVHAVSSRFVPAGLFAGLRAGSLAIAVLYPLWSSVRALLRTSKPMARLRMTEHRGRVSATMCYDYLPIHDVFRRVDESTMVGLMDMRGMQQPYFFVLSREKPGHPGIGDGG